MNFEPIISKITPLDAGQQQLLKLITVMAIWIWRHSCSAQTLNLPPHHDKEQTSSLASLEARWHQELYIIFEMDWKRYIITLAKILPSSLRPEVYVEMYLTEIDTLCAR